MSINQPLISRPSDEEKQVQSVEVMHNSDKAPRQLALKICMLFGCGAVYAARTVIPLVIQDIAKELDWSSVLVGYTLSFFFWGYALTQILGGYWADRIGGCRVMAMMSFVGAASLLLLPSLVPLWPAVAVLLRFLLGMAQGPHYPSMSSVASQLVPSPHRARFLSTAFIGSSIGTILMGLLGSIVLENHGWRTTVSLTGCIYGMSAMWAYWLTRDCPQPSQVTPRSSLVVPWCALLSNTAVWMCVWVHMTHAATWFILLSWLPSYFKQTHPLAKSWVVNTLPFLMNMAGTIMSVHLSEYLLHRRQYSTTTTRKIMEVISQLTAAVALFVLPSVSSSWMAALITSLIAGVEGLHVNGGLIVPQDLCPQHVGSLFGIMNTGGAVAGFLSNLVAGLLINTYGSYGPVFQMAGVLAACGALTFAMFGSAEPLKL